MNRIFFLLLFQLLIARSVSAQVNDSTKLDTIRHTDQKDSTVITVTSTHKMDAAINKDTSALAQAADSTINTASKDTARKQIKVVPLLPESAKKNFQGKELQFYLLVILLLIYGMLKRAFPKYFNDLFRLFFRTTIKQLQVREQLMQTPLPSLLLNIFFVIIGSLYISFILLNVKWNPINNFWLMTLYCIGGLSIIYSIKFFSLKVSGWLFNMQSAADAYIFIVFIINKMIGLVLLPFLIMLAFTQRKVYSVSLMLSLIVVVVLFAYRFILTYSAVRNQVKVNPFHFFLYFCAFEIAPLLLIYKALLLFFHISA